MTYSYNTVVETVRGLLNSKGKIETVALELVFVTNIRINHSRCVSLIVSAIL